MRIRPLNLILLASLVFWTTGAAHFIHEAMEDGDHDEIAVAEPGTNCDQPPQDSHSKHPAHDHDNCPTCQLLAHLQAHHTAPAPPVCVLQLTDFAQPIVDRHAPTLESRSLTPIRGPPAATAHFS